MARHKSAACEIERLPEELLTAVISLTSPPDACRAAAVSRTFRPAADSDAVWSGFLPRDLPQFAQGELPCTSPSKKALFRRLSDQPALLACKLVSMRLDRATGAKCFVFSSGSLSMSWDNIPEHFQWINVGWDEVKTSKRFSDTTANFWGIWWMEIHVKINSMVLSPNLTYTTHMVFKLGANGFNLLDFPFRDALVSVVGSNSTRQVCFQSYMDAGDDKVPQKHILTSSVTMHRCQEIALTHDIMLPQKRADGWMEVELGEFYYEEGYADEVYVSLRETERWKDSLLTVWGIEIRIKQ